LKLRDLVKRVSNVAGLGYSKMLILGLGIVSSNNTMEKNNVGNSHRKRFIEFQLRFWGENNLIALMKKRKQFQDLLKPLFGQVNYFWLSSESLAERFSFPTRRGWIFGLIWLTSRSSSF
jgi:hypothetical protein